MTKIIAKPDVMDALYESYLKNANPDEPIEQTGRYIEVAGIKEIQVNTKPLSPENLARIAKYSLISLKQKDPYLYNKIIEQALIDDFFDDPAPPLNPVG